MPKYRPRIADDILMRKLKGVGAVLIQGPKWCGKTTTAEQHARSVLYMDSPATMEQNLKLAEIAPAKLLVGDTPRLIDEWQLAPQLWDTIRFEVDHRDGFGHFILTGSAVPADVSQVHHTGTGRFAWLTMRTMSLFESGESNGDVSLKALFENPEADIFSTNPLSIDDIAYLICRGGWPQATMVDRDVALDQASNYFDAVVNADISRVDGVSRDADKARRIMRSLARNQGAQLSISAVCADLQADDGPESGRESVGHYVDALKKIFVIEDSPAWNPNLRSKTAIRTSDTRYFSDPSIAVSALGVGPADLIADLNTMGLLFETLCVRDLRVYADALGGSVYHYRDKLGLECDAVLHLRNGHYGLIEVKLGGDKNIDEGARTLMTLAEKIDLNKMPKPSFLMVLTGTAPYAYRRKDGVWVVPIGCLRH